MEEGLLENKADLMWQCILAVLFPIEEGYVVVVRDRVAHEQPADAADIMVKHLRPDKTLPIIFTMEDKRAQKRVEKKHWDQAAAQLEGYLTIERQSETGEGATRALHGAVAIGMLDLEFNSLVGGCSREQSSTMKCHGTCSRGTATVNTITKF